MLRVIGGGRVARGLPPRWRAVANQVVACSEVVSVELARHHWSCVTRLIEERRELLRDLQRAALDHNGRACVDALRAAIEESEAIIVLLAADRAPAESTAG